ncbi:MAG TPA: hypothetical protein VHN80_16645, partial [Kineosporiaceae bacterium]|nr:hypothetical protein [Kineosporiaceae bacterium]
LKENPMSTTIEPRATTPTTDPPPAEPTDVVPVATTLRRFAPGGDLQGHPAITPDGSSVVVLGYGPDHPEIIDVYGDQGTFPLAADTPATLVTDPTGCSDLLHATVVHLIERLREAWVAHTMVGARHERTLDEIRRYAVDRHLDDEFCRDGLNEFLRTFQMPIYQPRTRVSYTIAGSYQVEGHDSYRATRDATGYLTVDLSQIDGVLDDTDRFSVEVTEATALDT